MTYDDLVIPSIVLLLVLAIVRPVRITCPDGMWVEGVRPSGETRCIQLGDDIDCSGSRRCVDYSHQWSLRVKIYCTGGMRPIANNDGRTVGCQR